MTSTRDALEALSGALIDLSVKVDDAIDALDDGAAAPEAKPAPKVGDRVRILSGWTNGAISTVVGREGILTEIRENYGHTGRTWYNIAPGLTASEVEVIDAAPVEPSKRTFAKNDKVKIVGLSYYGRDNKGGVGTVLNPDYTGYGVTGRLVEVRGADGYIYLYAPQNIEPFAPEPVSKALDIESVHTDRRVVIEPQRFGTKGQVLMTIKRPDGRTGIGVDSMFAYIDPKQAKQIIAALQANIDEAEKA